MLSPNQAVLASGTSARAKAEALTTDSKRSEHRERSLYRLCEFYSLSPKALTEVVDGKLALALGSLVEHLPQLHHSVYKERVRRIPESVP